jgi:hypothetical protein
MLFPNGIFQRLRSDSIAVDPQQSLFADGAGFAVSHVCARPEQLCQLFSERGLLVEFPF